MGPPGNPWLSPFAEPADNKNFSERKSMFVSTKLEMIRKKGRGDLREGVGATQIFLDAF